MKIPLPEWLILGHTAIEEVGQNDGHFTMDFRLKHPFFGQIYRYAGRFRTETKENICEMLEDLTQKLGIMQVAFPKYRHQFHASH